MSRCVEYYEVILPRQLRQDNSAEGCSHDLISKQSKSEILRYLQLVDTLEDSGISRASAIAYLTEGASRPLLREHDAEKKAAAIAKVAEAIKARVELAEVKPRRVTEKDVERILNGDAPKPEAKAAQPEAAPEVTAPETEPEEPEAEEPKAEAPEAVEAEVITTETEEHAEPLVCPECEERGKAWADAQEAAPEVDATPGPEPEPKPTTKRKSKEAQAADAQNIVDEFKVLLKNARERYTERSYFNALKEIKTIAADELKDVRR